MAIGDLTVTVRFDVLRPGDLETLDDAAEQLTYRDADCATELRDLRERLHRALYVYTTAPEDRTPLDGSDGWTGEDEV